MFVYLGEFGSWQIGIGLLLCLCIYGSLVAGRQKQLCYYVVYLGKFGSHSRQEQLCYYVVCLGEFGSCSRYEQLCYYVCVFRGVWKLADRNSSASMFVCLGEFGSWQIGIALLLCCVFRGVWQLADRNSSAAMAACSSRRIPGQIQ